VGWLAVGWLVADLPSAVARAFVNDLRAFFAEKSPIKRDEIAARPCVVRALNV
jgi:hypothetical protein